MEKSEIIKTLQGLAPSDHAVLFYSDIHSKRELVFAFLEVAFRNHGVAIYVTEHEPFDEVRDAMRRWGINVEKYESDRSLAIANYQAVISVDGRFDDEKISQSLGDLMGQGGPIRVVTDATSLVKRGMVDEVMRRERVLRRRLELPLTMVCSYDETLADMRDGEFLIQMLRTHSHVVFPGIALPLA